MINLFHESSQITVKTFKKMKTKYMAILECDPLTHRMMLDGEFVYINWSRCKVFDHINVYRCFKCGGFNHNANQCRNQEKCLKCLDADHRSDCCENTIVKCPNCIEVNTKFKLDLNVNHFVFDKFCPVFLKRIETEKQKIKKVSE